MKLWRGKNDARVEELLQKALDLVAYMETHRLDTSDTHSMHGQNIADASSRYTPPTLREQRISPPWVPVLMFSLLGVGAVVILLYYLGFVPGGRNNWYLFSGLLAVLGGLYTATKYH